MPLNYLEIREQLEQFGAYAEKNAETVKTALERLRELLLRYADAGEEIARRVNLAREQHQSLRCAVPMGDALTAVYDEPHIDLPALFLLASDGSQIFPDPHSVIEYGVVNAGLLAMDYHSETAPAVLRETSLYYEGKPPFDALDLTEDSISFLRDIDERRLLSTHLSEMQMAYAQAHDGEMVDMLALTDGPLDLFAKPEVNSRQARHLFDGYLDSLVRIHQRNGMVAGYIERPRGTMIVRTLEVMDTAEADLMKKGQLERQFKGIPDIALFNGLLKPGQRTGVFRLISKNESQYTSRDPLLGLHFFYLNVGYLQRNGNPLDVFARVEIPAWVAKDKNKVAIIHQVLLEQTRILGTNPYPYLLHRAHETAIVRFAEKEELDRMVVSELLAKGVVLNETTQKSANKRVSGA